MNLLHSHWLDLVWGENTRYVWHNPAESFFPVSARRGDHLGIPLLDVNVKSLERGGPNLTVKALCTTQRRILAPRVAYSGLLETLMR